MKVNAISSNFNGAIPGSIISVALVAGIFRLFLSFYLNTDLKMNPDERRNYEIAKNHTLGRGYSILDAYNNTKGKNYPLLSSFHSSFTVFFYEFIIDHHIDIRNWVVVYNILSALLLSVSIMFFYLLCLFFLDSGFSILSTLLYCLFPSVLFYIGGLMQYENFALPLIIIVCYYLSRSLKDTLTPLQMAAVLLSVLTSVFFRSQTVAVYSVLFGVYFLFSLTRRKWRNIFMSAFVITIAVAIHIPVLQKNKDMFGVSIISTQAGFELLQGNNPLARGSFSGSWSRPTTPYYQYVHRSIPSIDSMNEYQESQARKVLALKWIKENKTAFVKLCFRKIAIFFLPQNFEVLPYYYIYNPFNLFIYLGFICAICLKAVKRNMDIYDWLILSPVIGSLVLTIIFFMGSRWRYYAEPFMIIFAVMFIRQIMERWGYIKAEKNFNSSPLSP